MGNSYYGLLRGRVMPIEFSAMSLLKGSEDSIFLLETGQMCGYTTRETIRRMLQNELAEERRNIELDALMEELSKLRVSEDFKTASENIHTDMPLLKWLGIE
ncbi:MAG: hypothetical protein ACOZCL_00155 [Bacillota bacterium]